MHFFFFLPSNRASGGIITIWKSALLDGQLAFQNEFSVSMAFTSKYSNDNWLLTNVYGPSTHEGKRTFLRWLKQVEMPHHVWLLVGDFNLMRGPENINRLGGDITEMMLFNDALTALGLVQLPLHGRKYARTNKQDPPSPLLESLDWFLLPTIGHILIHPPLLGQ